MKIKDENPIEKLQDIETFDQIAERKRDEVKK